MIKRKRKKEREKERERSIYLDIERKRLIQKNLEREAKRKDREIK